MQLVASFERDLVMPLVMKVDGVISGRRYHAVCRRCGVRDDLSFTHRGSAEARKDFCECDR